MAGFLSIKLTEDELRGISVLGLAHVGDAVYELMVRTWLARIGRATAKGLHKASVGYVSAAAQAQAANKITAYLSEEELAVLRRGRNSRVNSVPRSATREEYHTSTALEALFGYLYLSGKTERLNELFEKIVG